MDTHAYYAQLERPTMGFADRKPILPAATESLLGSNLGVDRDHEQLVEEAATDLSIKTDRTHHTIPDDGRPITITTGSKTTGKIFKTDNHSQTSLLIEYYEAGNSTNSGQKPSIRVKVHPSSKTSKNNGAHILLKQGHGVTKTSAPASTRRISLTSKPPRSTDVADDLSLSSAPYTSNKLPPVEIGVPDRSGHRSDSTISPELRYAEAPSDISSMPTDSMLGAQRSTLVSAPVQPLAPSDAGLPLTEDSTYNQAVTVDTTALKPPVMPQERNLSSERLTQKVIEKLSNRPKDTITPERVKKQRLSGSLGREVAAGSPSHPTRSTTKSHKDDDSMLSVSDPSVLTNSAVYPNAKAYDQRSSKSAISNNSIQNNPKLLQTVEDAIKRLILPELKEIKKDQRHASHRSKYDKDYSDLSTSSASLDKTSRRVSSGSKSRRRTSKGEDGSGSKRRKSGHRDSYGYDSLSDEDSRRHSVSSVSDHKQKSKHRTRHDQDVSSRTLEHNQSEESLDHRRRKRRSRSRSSRSGSIAESEEAFAKHKIPPMPMQSEIGSELTRSSLLSSNTTDSYTPTQHNVREVTRGGHAIVAPSPPTPTTRSKDTQNTLGMHHGNFSEHNLSTNKFAQEQSDNDGTLSPELNRYSYDNESLEDAERMRQYERNLHTQHPIRRGLSPIQSVASYTTTTEPHRNSMIHPKSIDSFASTRRAQDALKREVSLNSLTSTSPDFRSRNRPHGISLENRSEIMGQHGVGPVVSADSRNREGSYNVSQNSRNL